MKPIVYYALDFHCPVCRAVEDASCVARGHEGETLPHASRVMLAEQKNRVELDKRRFRAERHQATGWRKLPAPKTMEEVVDRMLLALSLQSHPCKEVSALGVWKVPSKLFVPGDPVFLHWNNGGGERCGIIAWSSKKKAVIGPKYHRFARYWYKPESQWRDGESKLQSRMLVDVIVDFTEEARREADAAYEDLKNDYNALARRDYEGYPRQFIIGEREGSGGGIRHAILPAFRARRRHRPRRRAGERERRRSLIPGLVLRKHPLDLTCPKCGASPDVECIGWTVPHTICEPRFLAAMKTKREPRWSFRKVPRARSIEQETLP
jgi:hypothetical protein